MVQCDWPISSTNATVGPPLGSTDQSAPEIDLLADIYVYLEAVATEPMRRPHFSRPSRDRRVVLFTVHSQSDLNSVRQKALSQRKQKDNSSSAIQLPRAPGVLVAQLHRPGEESLPSPSKITDPGDKCKKIVVSRSWLSVSSTNAGRHCSGYVLTFPAKHIIIR
jgi:hypothetical protein